MREYKVSQVLQRGDRSHCLCVTQRFQWCVPVYNLAISRKELNAFSFFFFLENKCFGEERKQEKQERN